MKLSRGATLLIGGARSGKSDLTVELGRAWPGLVTFVATAEAGDDDMATRIARHQSDRPADWGLLEAPHFDATALRRLCTTDDVDHLVIVDCLTMLTANRMFQQDQPTQPVAHDDTIVTALEDLATTAGERDGPTIFVTNEVGLGVHPESALGRRYRDLLGRVNRAVAERVHSTLFVVAGRAIPLEEIEVSW